MAGLLGRTFMDDPGAVGMGGGGLLGPMTGAQKAALLFAGLRDSVGSFSGRPTQNLNQLAEMYGQQNYRQQVRQDRLSDKADEKARHEQARKDQMEVALSPQEALARGYRPGVVVYRNGLGVERLGQASDMKSTGAIDQEVDLMNRNPSLDIARGNLALSRQQFGETVRNNQFANSISLLNAQDAMKARQLANTKAQQELRDKDMTRKTQAASYDTAIQTLDRLKTHPGFNSAVGFGTEKSVRGVVSALPFIDAEGVTPGTKRADFVAELDAFKAQAFLPMVAQLKGMGALSDAEGKKLTDAVGALNASMSEDAFVKSVDRIKSDLAAARQRAGGAPAAPAQRQAAPAGAGAPKPFSVIDGYRFKGGDPADKNNWVKI